MNRTKLFMWTLLILLTVGATAGCSTHDTGPDRDPSVTPPTEAPETTAEIPVEEPTVQETAPQSPEDLSRAQQQLDAQCAEMDIQEAQEMGIAPEEYGCETDGTGIPIREWLEQNE